MLFREPCCDQLREAMEEPYDQHMLHPIGKPKLLLLTTGVSKVEIEGEKTAKAWFDIPIQYCHTCNLTSTLKSGRTTIAQRTATS